MLTVFFLFVYHHVYYNCCDALERQWKNNNKWHRVQIYKTFLKVVFLHFQHYEWENKAGNLQCLYSLLKKLFLISHFISTYSHTHYIQVEVFWAVMLCNVAGGYKCFRGPCCLHVQGEDGGSMDLWNVGFLPQYYKETQKALNWISTAMKTPISHPIYA